MMPSRVDGLLSDLKEYVNLRTDAIKLQVIEGISVICGRLLGVMIAVMVGVVAILIFVAAIVVILSWLLDSLFWAFIIVGACLSMVALWLYALRDRLFVDSFVKSLCSLLFADGQKD
ncbi:MAG: hypothetical protein J6K90_02330 [Tidjanibacter sp.]|nr:hypothetical protein [Tidjanibacter sp.]